MPTQPGKHTLPAFTLHWWDTTTDSEQVATLPERTIEVLPAAGQQQNPSAAFNDFAAESGEMTGQKTAQGTSANPLLQTERTANTVTSSTLNHSGWFWASLLFAALWLITLALWWNNKRHRVLQVGDEKKHPARNPGTAAKPENTF